MADDSLWDLPRTRKEARKAGLKHYFTGMPCIKGHVAKRFATSAGCEECAAVHTAARRAKNPEIYRKRQRELYHSDPERFREYQQLYRDANVDKVREAARNWAKNNPEKKRAYRVANREQIREWRTAYRAANAAKIADKNLAWKQKNRDIINEKRRAHRAKHPDVMRTANARTKAWKKANPDQVRVAEHAMRARRAAADGAHTAADISRIRKAQKDKCSYCRTKLKGEGHLDHILALSRGGRNSPDNLQLLCKPCNLAKWARDPVEFAQSLGFLI
jgi:5-methylcytosine-specific restriction endonuclease McrA